MKSYTHIQIGMEGLEMAGPKGGKPPELTLGDMASVAGKIFLPEPMQRAGETIKPIFDGVSAARQAEERRAPMLDSAPGTGPSRNAGMSGSSPDSPVDAVAARPPVFRTGRQRDADIDDAVNAALGVSPPKPPGM